MDRLEKIFADVTKVFYDDVEIYLFLAEVDNELSEEDRNILREKFRKHIENHK